MDNNRVIVSQPLLIPEIAQIICSFVCRQDMLNVALSCRTMYYAMIARLWHTLHPRSHMVLRKLKNTLDGRYINTRTITTTTTAPTTTTTTTTLDPQYNRQVRVFRWSLKEDVTTHMFERPFFDHFLFPRLHTLVFSYAAAQDSSVAPMIKASVHHLRYVDLSHCYCLSTDAIRPLLKMPSPALETLILYGCGKIESRALVSLVQQHHRTLTCVRLTDITDSLLDALQHCHQLQDLGLEHCSDFLSEAGLTRFAHALASRQHQRQPLARLRFRDISNLTSTHLEHLAYGRALVHLDMSECARITSQGLAQLAPLCPQLNTLCLAYQSGVTNTSLRAFSDHCHLLRHLDVAGSRSLTDDAFRGGSGDMDTDDSGSSSSSSSSSGGSGGSSSGGGVDVVTRFATLYSLNLSGLESQLSTALIYQLLIQWPTLQELCLGVAYDLGDAKLILDQVNVEGVCLYQMNVEKCHTICRLPPPPSSLV